MDSTYAPQSPDRSTFLSSPSKTQQPYQPTQSAAYAPRSPVIPAFNNSQPQQQHHNLHHPYHHQQQHQQQPPPPPQQQLHPNPQQAFGLGGVGSTEFAEYGSQPYMPPIPALPPAHSSFGAPANPSPYYQPQRTIKNEDPYDYKPSFDGPADDSDYVPSPTMSAARGPHAHNPMAQAGAFGAAPPQQQQQHYKNPNPNNIEIRTKFPVARIKRIMQADEEVGKVAQVTPVAVSKALELFMIALVSGAAEKAKEKGGKRVTAQHLKMVVEGDEQFDFLSEIVGKVADVQEGAGGSRRKEKVEGSDSEEEKKVKKGKGRRKKGDD